MTTPTCGPSLLFGLISILSVIFVAKDLKFDRIGSVVVFSSFSIAIDMSRATIISRGLAPLGQPQLASSKSSLGQSAFPLQTSFEARQDPSLQVN